MAKELRYRSPLGGISPNVFADWLNDLRARSGAYVIRKRVGHEVLYVGESHTGRLAKTIKRHFYRWKDDEERKHFTADPREVEVAVRLTPPNTAVAAQNNLIHRLDPKKNGVIPF